MKWVAWGVIGLMLMVSPAAARQLAVEPVLAGLTHPVAFIQDPSDPNTQFVVEQGGRIRPVVNGELQAENFLDLSDIVSTNGEEGLLGLAFAPDYAASGRFYVNFINRDDNTVIARFVRSSDNPLTADPASRFDLVWPDGNPFIWQPYCCHYGGHLAFGPDGYLYIALGDGGAGGDPDHHAQNPGSLLGKVLRINVSVPDTDAEGYDVPDDNPFVGQDGVLPEIWDAGLRNPWRYTFDNPALGGSGALIIGDVGQDSWEEFDYEPAGRGGRNYGWRLREGAHDYDASLGPWFEPLTEPTFQYDHDAGRTIIGGYVYRGQALGSAFFGRYFFGDFVMGHLWSVALAIDSASGEATATELVDHTPDVDPATGTLVAFGEDAGGELYLVSWRSGTVYRLVPGTGPPFLAPRDVTVFIDAPSNGGTTSQPFTVAGWALDWDATANSGIDYVDVWAAPDDGSSPRFLGRSSPVSRPDVAQAFGSQFLMSGFNVTAHGLPAGPHHISVLAHSIVTNRIERTETIAVQVSGTDRVTIDGPADGSSVPARFAMGGWGLDGTAPTGTGIDEIDIWARAADGTEHFVGAAHYGISRPDVGAVFGAQFTFSGWDITVTLDPGRWTLLAYARSSITGTLQLANSITVNVMDSLLLQVDRPFESEVASTHGEIVGWALDLSSTSGPGVDTVHVWAIPADGRPATFVGHSELGDWRPDVGAAFGSPFAAAGFHVPYALPAGDYYLCVYGHSIRTNSFAISRVVRVSLR